MHNVTPTSPHTRQRLVSKLQTRLAGFAFAPLAAAAMLATAEAGVIQAGTITISDGEVLTMRDNVAADPGAAPPIFGTILIDAITLTITPSGVLDIQNNAVIVRMTPFNTIYGYVVNGYNGGTWDGVGGISSSFAASDPTHLFAVGIINNAEAQYTTFLGAALGPASESLVAYTYYGDANLDRDVTLEDLALIGTGSGWYHGDFNYDGTVSAADYDLFYASLSTLHPEQIPEPGSLGLMAAGVAGLLARRRAPRSVSQNLQHGRMPHRASDRYTQDLNAGGGAPSGIDPDLVCGLDQRVAFCGDCWKPI